MLSKCYWKRHFQEKKSRDYSTLCLKGVEVDPLLDVEVDPLYEVEVSTLSHLKEHWKLVQKLASKVTYHFVEGHLSRKQTVNGIRSRRLCAQEAALFLNENAMEIKFNLVSENSHVKSIKPVPFVFFWESKQMGIFSKGVMFWTHCDAFEY